MMVLKHEAAAPAQSSALISYADMSRGSLGNLNGQQPKRWHHKITIQIVSGARGVRAETLPNDGAQARSSRASSIISPYKLCRHVEGQPGEFKRPTTKAMAS